MPVSMFAFELFSCFFIVFNSHEIFHWIHFACNDCVIQWTKTRKKTQNYNTCENANTSGNCFIYNFIFVHCLPEESLAITKGDWQSEKKWKCGDTDKGLQAKMHAEKYYLFDMDAK